ncbi:crotonase/enoyl-CoA hydratase family protein [Paraglaciecola sp. MB-3u-78]|uniref:crotonase/enoyl-CoA hydratase family protein n=1 Tax=Paraglaciecola sp. MB-3u-78 TaxID=2058332 RepID=UPI000C33E13A|nr:crotonase/enoyl-CoA hydratase family protein [Paraglaciecola sp. MB-3u-78]PKG97236.1 enoyl-CoA hydratase [Paraglaciecola sp. MB-3u-78]
MKYELLEGGIAKISLDNGKANAVSFDLAQEFMANLDRAKTESKGVLIAGHVGIFSAGFDLKVMATGPEAAHKMVSAGMLLLEKIYSHPHPVVVACEGHAIGMGVFLLLVADYRIGASGEFVLKLPETAIDMPFNATLRILAKTHIDPLHHTRAIIQSQGYSPAEAAVIGMLDEAVEADQVQDKALAKLTELCELPSARYEENKLFMRAEEIQAIYESLHGDN